MAHIFTNHESLYPPFTFRTEKKGARNTYSQSIPHVVKKHEFKREFVQVYVLFPWSSPINVISLKVRERWLQALMSHNHRNRIIVSDWFVDRFEFFYTMKFFIKSELCRSPLPALSPSPSTSFSFHSLWDFTSWPDHRQRLEVNIW